MFMKRREQRSEKRKLKGGGVWQTVRVYTHPHRQTDRQTDRQTHTHTHTDRHRHTHTHRQADTHTQTHTHTHTCQRLLFTKSAAAANVSVAVSKASSPDTTHQRVHETQNHARKVVVDRGGQGTVR